jgi:acetylornithine deacetylase
MAASTPSKRHARGVAAVLDRVPRPDAAVYLHPAESGSGLAEIKACTPGLLEFVIDIAGAPPDTAEPGHAAFTHRGRTTAGVVESVLAALRTLDAARGSRVRHPRIGSFVGRATNVMVSGIRAGMPGRRNRLPVAAVIEGSVSFPPGETLQAVMDEVAAAVRGAVLPAGWPAELAPRVAFPAGVAGAEVDGDHPLFLLAAGAIRSEAGIEPMVNPVHTASDIRVPIHQKGIPTIGLGPLAGDLTQNGRVDEWVNLRDQSLAASVLGRLIRDWCG